MLNQPDPWSRKRAAEGSPEPIKRASTTGADSCLGPSSRNLLWTFVSSPADSPCSDISQSSILSSFSKHVCRATPHTGRRSTPVGLSASRCTVDGPHPELSASTIRRRASETNHDPSVPTTPGFKSADGYYFRHLRSLENELTARGNFLPADAKGTAAITASMRCKLVSWLFEVTPLFPLLPESLFLAVTLLDRYLAAVPETGKQELQLLGICCLMIAAKYEETVLVPSTEIFCEMTAHAYTRQQLIDMEVRVLTQLEHRVGVPTSHAMLWILNSVLKLDKQTLFMTCYLLELSTVEYLMLQYPPSTLAAAAIFLATATLGQKMSEGAILFLEEHCGEGVVACVKMMNELHNVPCDCENAMDKVWGPIWQKYKSPRRGYVAAIPAQVLIDDEDEDRNDKNKSRRRSDGDHSPAI